MQPAFSLNGGVGISQVSNTGITTAQIFPLLTQGSIGVNGVLSSDAKFSATVPTLMPVPGSGRFEGRYFVLTASGWVTVGGVSPTVAVTLYSGTSLTPGSNTILKTSGTQSLTTGATYPWMVTLEGIGDTLSGILSGIVEVQIGNNITLARAALASTLSALAFSFTNPSPSAAAVASEPVFNACVGITFGVANAANVSQMNQFVLEG